MKYIVFYILITMFSYLNASVIVGKVDLFKGNIKVKRENSIKKEKVSSGFEIKSGDLLMSLKKSTAQISLKDGSILIIDEKSSIHFNSITNIEQKSGKVLYEITSRDATNSLKIKTPFAIIGIKGTTFIVNSKKGDEYISLKEGKIGISSLKEEFKLYKQKVKKEFDNYNSKQQSGFMKFKNAQTKYQDAELTKKFDLAEGHKVLFSGSRVQEDSMIDNDKAEFEYFKKLINDIK